MSSIIDIIDGHVKELTNENEELYEKRINICKECPLYKETSLGPICNPKLYINKDGDVSSSPKQGYKHGCACRLRAKTRLTYSKCIIDKW